ncbi:hypothetical protein [Streptomyces bambusae]|uniref:Sigma-like protein n=1 Tax=Streptomyces bambusae TaxID=1550616 RepID=A0ABS6Z833_9ACTN|nr:hypothetical protein [Streptomyces bambusae]MBW5483911.1 hypothetical protein [Streptomyces bambusae]
MTTSDSAAKIPNDGDIKPFDNHATGIEITPMDNHATSEPLLAPDAAPTAPTAPAKPPVAPGEEIETLDNHATGPRP